MKRQFVSDVVVFSIACHAKKAEELIALVKSYEHALLSADKVQPAEALFLKIKDLCALLDAEFPRTMPLLVEHSRHELNAGVISKISVKPSRRGGGFSDSYWVIMTLIDVKHDFHLAHDQESLQADAQTEKGGDAL